MTTKRTPQGPKTVEPTNEELLRHIGGLQYELQEAHALVGTLTIQNKRQERVIAEMQQKQAEENGS